MRGHSGGGTRCREFAEGSYSYSRKSDAWWEAENALADARLIGDLAVAAFFGAEKDKARKELTKPVPQRCGGVAYGRGRTDVCWEGIVEELRSCEKPVAPMHWEIEFPEVFDREKPGFDAIVGNPPFAGKNTCPSSART